MPGLDRDPLDDDVCPSRSITAIGMVVGALRRAGDEDEDEIGGVGRGRSSAAARRSGSSGSDRADGAATPPPRSTIAPSISEFVSTNLPRTEVGADRYELVARRQDARRSAAAAPRRCDSPADASDGQVGGRSEPSGVGARGRPPRRPRRPGARSSYGLTAASIAAPDASRTTFSRLMTASVRGRHRVTGVDRCDMRRPGASAGAPRRVRRAGRRSRPSRRRRRRARTGVATIGSCGDAAGGAARGRWSPAPEGACRRPRARTSIHRASAVATSEVPRRPGQHASRGGSSIRLLRRSAASRLPLRHDDAEAGGATALQYRRRARAPAAGR